MDLSRLSEPMRRALAELNARNPVEHVRAFLRGHVAAAQDLDEVRRDLCAVASFSTFGLRRDLDALTEVTRAALPEGVLARLVGWDGNRVLDDPSDEGAKAFLREVTELLRTVLAEAPGVPRRGRQSREPEPSAPGGPGGETTP